MSAMERRTYLGVMLAGAVAAGSVEAAPAKPPIQLHCDLDVDPKREQEMLNHFDKVFRPVARKQPGFIDLKMLKVKDQIRGKSACKYQFVLTMESEELRQKWINTPDHAKAWPGIENTLLNKDTFSILVYDVY